MSNRENLDLQTNIPLEAQLKYLDHYEGEHGARTKATVVVKACEGYPDGEYNLWMAGWAMDALVEQGAATEGTMDAEGRRQFKTVNKPRLQILRREERVDGEIVKRTNITLVSGGRPPAEGQAAPPAQGAPPSSPPDGNQPHPARAAGDVKAKAAERRRGIFKAWLGVIDAYSMTYGAAKILDPEGNHHAMASTMLIQGDKQGLVVISSEVPGLCAAMLEHLDKRLDEKPEPTAEPSTDQPQDDAPPEEGEDDLPF